VIHVSPAATPVFATVADITVPCGGATTSDLSYDNGLTGNCNLSGTVTSTLSTLPGNCGGNVTETWTATVCGTLITKSRIIHVSPAATPVFATVADITVPCGAATTSDLSYDNGLTGNCRIFGTVTSTLTTVPGGCGGDVTETWTATVCGTIITASRIIHVSPAATPSFAAVADINVSCGGATTHELAYDNGLQGDCRIHGIVTSTLSTIPGACGGDVTETWTATVCGNTITKSRTIHVSPALTPSFPVQSAITVSCGGATTHALTYDNGLSGSCRLTGTVTSTLSTLPGVCGGDVTETWTAVVCGNTISASRIIHVSPATPPSFPAQTAITVACGGATTSNLTYDNGLTGSCRLTGTVTSTLGTIQGACGGDVTETWTAVVCGNTITTSRVIHVSPAPAPVFPAVGNSTVPCGGVNNHELTYDNGLTGNCRLFGAVSSTLTPIPDACGGDVTETWTAVVCGNTITRSRIIHVNPAPAPVFAAVQDITVACGGAIPSDLAYDNGMTNNCRLNGTVTSTLNTLPGACGGDVTETWTATVCGNTITKSRIIHVSPAPAPVFATVQAITVPCGGATTSSLTYDNGLTGNCRLNGTVTSTLSTIPGACGGDVTETWTATVCGNLITKSRIIHVSPATAPVFASVQDITVSCGGATTSTLAYDNGLTGNCKISGTATSTLSTIPGACGGNVTETWSVVVCGNTVTKSRIVHVNPATAPVFASVQDITVSCGGATTSNLAYDNGLTGNCRLNGTVTSTLSTIPGACGGNVTETWSTVVCGNTITKSRTIHVNPASLPVMTAPATITVSCNSDVAPSTITYSNGQSGNCNISGVSNLSTFTVITPGSCNGRILEKWTATDPCGRTLAEVSRTILVKDRVDPVVTCPASPQSRTVLPPQTTYTAIGNEFDYLSASDNCSAVTVTNDLTGTSTLAGYAFEVGTTTVTWTATDACDNKGHCSHDVVIYAPSISLHKSGHLNKGVVAPDRIANVGDQITYTFDVTNTGNLPLYNITINDPKVTVTGGPVTLAPGSTNHNAFTAVYTLVQADVVAGRFTNVATASGTTSQGATVTDSDSDTREYVSIAGNIYDDHDGMENSMVSGSPTNGSGNLYINIVTADKGVISSLPVDPDGTYYFTMDEGVEFTTDYNIILTSSPQIEGDPLNAASYPTNWVSTGEILGSGSGNDGTIDGILAVSTFDGSIDNANFGLDQLPESFDATATYPNPGGSNKAQVPLLTGTDPEDGVLGSGKSIVITSLATNGTLYYNGVAVTLNQVIASYNPVLLQADPVDGDVIVTFNYAFIDIAGEQDPTPALVTIHFNICAVLVTNPQGTCSPGTVDLTAPAVTAGSTLYGATLSYWLDANATIQMPNPQTAGTGTYYIKASREGCSEIKPVTVMVHPLPTVFNVNGSGSYCAGGAGIEIIMSGSQPGVIYTLWYGLYNPIGNTVTGTGNPISFGYQTLPGIYSILAENPVTHCTNWSFNCAYIFVDQPVQVSVSVVASENPVPTGTPVSFTATAVNGGTTPAYQWKVNGLNAGTNSTTFTYVPLNGDQVACILTSNAYCVSGNPAAASVTMQVDGISPSVIVTGIVEAGTDRCYNATQTLTVAGGGNSFTVQSGATATMIAGHNILFLPGTSVMAGGYMHGYITLDDQYCGQQAPAIPTVVNSSGTEDPAVSSMATSFNIYPNPTSGNFTVEQKGTTLNGDVKVEVYSMRGEKLMTGHMIGEKKHEFWLTDLPHGLYFVKVIAGTEVETFKLVVKK
jgi:uncharacterized membrane protein YecN with MAPEG domain